jgi:tRNA threonylcarbamoyladenosine biosynthesis protein TsaE
MSIQLKSESAAETKKIGEALGKFLQAGDVVALEGELGAGKTTMVKGIAKGLGVRGSDEEVLSPTFTLIHEYEGREKIFHIDWYRLESVKGVDALQANECFSSGAVTLVEWPGRGKKILPDEKIWITLLHHGETGRKVVVELHGKKMKQREKELMGLLRVKG